MESSKMLLTFDQCEVHEELRRDMVEYIQFRMKQKQVNSPQTYPKKEMVGMAKLIEIQLFVNAETIEEYMESADDEEKMKAAAIKIIQRHLEKRQRKIVGFRSRMTLKKVSAQTA